jgi:putative hemolysin
MTTLADIAIILLLILINGLFSMSEVALITANRTRLTVLERKGVAGAARARRLAGDPQRFLPSVQLGITLVAILSGVFGGDQVAGALTPLLERVPLLRPVAPTLAVAVVVVVITYLTMVVGELVPKQLAMRRPEHLAVSVAGPLNAFAAAAAPVIWLLRVSSSLVLRAFGFRHAAPQTVTEEELKALLVEGEQTGVLESEERDMIERVLRLADKPVRALMTPRTELAWIDRTDTASDIAVTLRESPHSRFVVCDGVVDNVVGVIQAKDVLDRVLDGKDMSIAAVLRQPIAVPDTVTALDALQRLKTDPLGLALVLDEYGSFEGVVTAADVLAAIVGEPEPAAPEPVAGASAAAAEMLLEGSMPVDELKARLELPDLPAEGSYHTAAGLVLALLRRVPRQNDRVVFGGWLFEVVAMDGRRVERLRASREALAEE